MHIMGIRNSTIKYCAYLQKDEAIWGLMEKLRWKNFTSKIFLWVLGVRTRKFNNSIFSAPSSHRTANLMMIHSPRR